MNQSTFDFSKYAAKSNLEDNGPAITKANSESPGVFDFNNYRVSESPSPLQEFGRHAARTASRIGESIYGLPGDIVSLVDYLGQKLPEKPASYVKKGTEIASKILPTSEELKQFSSKLTSGFTDPKSANEELGDEISGLASVLVSPSKAVTSFPKFLKTIGSSVAKATGVKGAGKGAELLGADETSKNFTELGALFLTGFLGRKSADKYVGEQYQKARSKIPQGTMIPTTDLANALNKVDKELARGVSTATKDEVRKTLSELHGKASGGAMELDEIVESFHNINEKINSKKLFDELNSTDRKLLKRRYDLVKDEISSEIKKYEKSNPEFYKKWSNANEAFATIAQSKKISHFLQSKLGKIPNHLAASLALDLFLKTPLTTASVGTGYSAVKAGELLYRIAKSPNLRDHYMKVLLEASNENLPGVIKHLNALDKAISKE